MVAPMTAANNTDKAGKTPCRKCNGQGYLPQYAGRDKGECYACNGRGHKGGKPRYTIYGELIQD